MKDPVKHCTLYKEEGCSHVDGMLCDFETYSMRVGYDNKYLALRTLLQEHNEKCDAECRSWCDNCADDLAIGRLCGSCPKYYKVDFK